MFLSDDDMIECPYNKTHRMLRKRLQSHLIKCRLSYPDVELRKCPFNITHLIPEPEFTHHATNCPDRKLITQYKYDAPEPKEEERPKHAPIECEEDWDETDVTDYNPQLYLEKANVIRKPDGFNPSERKLFIKNERERLGDGDYISEDETSEVQSKNDEFPSRLESTSGRGYHNRRSSSPSTSSNSRRRSRSPINKSNRNRSRSPADKRSYVEHSLPRRNSPVYSRRSSSPSTSLFFRQRSRSPINISNRNRSRSPVDNRRSYMNHIPPRRSSPDYSSRYSPPPNSVRRTLYSYNPDKDPYYNGGDESHSNIDCYDNDNDIHAYYDRNSSNNFTIPRVPPPPLISYPAPHSYLNRTHRPTSNY